MKPTILTQHFQFSPREKALALSPGEIHIWYLADYESFSKKALFDSLSDWEKAKYQSFRHPKKHVHFLLGHGMLHDLLLSYTDCTREELQLSATPLGRLEMNPFSHVPPLDFNISHSGHYVTLAISRDYRVGLDIQEKSHFKNIDKLAKRVLHPNEYTHYLKVPQNLRPAIFTQYWAIKEAYIKATGQGLSCSTQSFQIKYGDSINTNIALPIYDLQGAFSPWTAQPLQIVKGYRAALVYTPKAMDISTS